MQYTQPVPEEPVVIETPTDPSESKYALIPEMETIYFDFDKSKFESAGISDEYMLHTNAYLQKNPHAKLSIIGHADELGTKKYNYKLGYKRAESVRYYFESKGIPKDKITIDSRGETEPVGNNNSDAGREKNRRTEITIKN
jgi:outer membrane protein OmpA-like peptidoglycan-associated protein